MGGPLGAALLVLLVIMLLVHPDDGRNPDPDADD